MEDLKHFERVQQFAALSQRAYALFVRLTVLKSRAIVTDEFEINDVTTIWSAFSKTWMEIAASPQKWLSMQSASLAALSDALANSAEISSDRRFRDKEWERDPFAKAFREGYGVIEKVAKSALEALPAGTKEHLRVQFYTRQIVSALSPSNFIMLNPSARKRFLDSEGQSLLDGFENLLHDLEKGDGRLDISTNDRTVFVVGRDLATTPGKVIYQNALMELIQYEPTTKEQWKTPILLVPAWINKYYIFDLRPENSFVRYLVDQGYTVFVISWVNPDKRHADKDFADYMELGPLAAIDMIEKATSETKVNILGFCIGGILVTATAAYVAAVGEDRLATVTTLATMIDFRDVGEIGVFIDSDRLTALRSHMAEKGYLENYHLQDMFSMIRENDLVWSYHVNNYLLGRNPPAFDLLYWNSDSTRLPAKMLLWYLEKIYIQNALREEGALTLKGKPINISKIEVPMFVLATKDDHIAPWNSVYPTTQIVRDVTFVLGGSGHIAGVINPPSQKKKYGFWTGKDYAVDHETWLATAKQNSGSWWPFWEKWLAERHPDTKVASRFPGSAGSKIISQAPGSYVKIQ
ncbi:MAG: class I poly(R)-hydroxyalkanoic acid synthase [Pseudomonadota bacterium]